MTIREQAEQLVGKHLVVPHQERPLQQSVSSYTVHALITAVEAALRDVKRATWEAASALCESEVAKQMIRDVSATGDPWKVLEVVLREYNGLRDALAAKAGEVA